MQVRQPPEDLPAQDVDRDAAGDRAPLGEKFRIDEDDWGANVPQLPPLNGHYHAVQKPATYLVPLLYPLFVFLCFVDLNVEMRNAFINFIRLLEFRYTVVVVQCENA